MVIVASNNQAIHVSDDMHAALTKERYADAYADAFAFLDKGKIKFAVCGGMHNQPHWLLYGRSDSSYGSTLTHISAEPIVFPKA